MSSELTIKEQAFEAIRLCHIMMPGKTDEEKKLWCEGRLSALLESVDDLIPVIGKFMDSPIVDAIEAKAIKLLVDWAWSRYNK